MTLSSFPGPMAPNAAGSLWMIGAMAAFAAEDALIKAVSATLPVGQALVLFGLGGALLFAAYLRRISRPVLPPEIWSPVMGLRLIFEAGGRLLFFLAVVYGSLSTATIILQATPVVVVLGAWAVFGERPGVLRWAATGLGALGVAIVVEPDLDSLSWAALLAALGMIGFAGRDLASRAAPKSLHVAHLGLIGFLTVAGAGVVFGSWEQAGYRSVPLETGFLLVLASGIGVVAYGCLMKAMRTGDVSAVAPFRYFRLLFGVALGVAVFGEQLQAQTILGAGFILFSGLLLWLGGRSLRTKASAS